MNFKSVLLQICIFIFFAFIIPIITAAVLIEYDALEDIVIVQVTMVSIVISIIITFFIRQKNRSKNSQPETEQELNFKKWKTIIFVLLLVVFWTFYIFKNVL